MMEMLVQKEKDDREDEFSEFLTPPIELFVCSLWGMTPPAHSHKRYDRRSFNSLTSVRPPAFAPVFIPAKKFQTFAFVEIQ